MEWGGGGGWEMIVKVVGLAGPGRAWPWGRPITAVAGLEVRPSVRQRTGRAVGPAKRSSSRSGSLSVPEKKLKLERQKMLMSTSSPWIKTTSKFFLKRLPLSVFGWLYITSMDLMVHVYTVLQIASLSKRCLLLHIFCLVPYSPLQTYTKCMHLYYFLLYFWSFLDFDL